MPHEEPETRMGTNMEQDIITLSRQKWHWMSERQTEPLTTLFHEKAVFVHMGATMAKDEEIEVIRSGQIHYKEIDIQETSVRFIETTAILLNKIRLVAVVDGHEVTNPSWSPRSTSKTVQPGRWPHFPSPDSSLHRCAWGWRSGWRQRSGTSHRRFTDDETDGHSNSAYNCRARKPVIDRDRRRRPVPHLPFLSRMPRHVHRPLRGRHAVPDDEAWSRPDRCTGGVPS
jgi:Domain of unknown function (DUF4440)